MPHDKNGNPLRRGDEVLVRFRVKQVNQGEDFCNVELESLEHMQPSGPPLTIMAINSRQTELVEGGWVDLDPPVAVFTGPAEIVHGEEPLVHEEPALVHEPEPAEPPVEAQ